MLSEILDFQAELDPTGKTTRAKIALLVRVIRESDTRIVGSKRFDVTTPAADDSAEAITGALEDGLNRLLPEMTAWIMGRTKVATR